jgi:hypothetical protein
MVLLNIIEKLLVYVIILTKQTNFDRTTTLENNRSYIFLKVYFYYKN